MEDRLGTTLLASTTTAFTSVSPEITSRPPKQTTTSEVSFEGEIQYAVSPSTQTSEPGYMNRLSLSVVVGEGAGEGRYVGAECEYKYQSIWFQDSFVLVSKPVFGKPVACTCAPVK